MGGMAYLDGTWYKAVLVLVLVLVLVKTSLWGAWPI